MKILEKIRSIDLQFFHKLRTYSVSKKIDILLRTYIYMGDGYIWAFVLAYFAIFDGLNKMFEVIKAVLPIAILSLVVYHAIKLLVKRKRPYESLPDVNTKISPMDRYSFPSGHTMNNLAISFGLIHCMHQIGCIFTIVLVLMPISWDVLRIYYGLHWLSDVIAGIILAGLCFWVGTIIPLNFLFP